ncbi:hypothetical protein A3J15_01710 [Candidatus Roizmanbacteria bacterium RIFCSPLOWO2_02_FULL_38_10]|uniref:Bacterial Ig domain-containing protein n=1 Tax=Candidatus Roizmanbacteria bacterium RIFCSPLOWO2_02_FULL_38_10 TaxID=1802074 RepID=A0A1F7JNQ0_9BACT|nr:MAG: hypothetical protein A3J15_01710 [Candidatus Roizmanbacteria bacterium RIFCSPLOWO2_02_FULL_38_10]
MNNRHLIKNPSNSSKLALYLFLLFALIIFMATVGLRLIINTSIFVANLNNKNATDNSRDVENNYLEAPEIINIPEATNSAEINISGIAQSGLSVYIYVNDEEQKQLISDEDGFQTAIRLKDGANEVYAELEDKENNLIKKSKVYQVVYKSAKPILTIDSPQDGEKIAVENIKISGQTDVNSQIKINSQPVVVDVNGKFSYDVRLKEGENTIFIESRDEAGNLESKMLKVIYEK